MKSLFPTGVYLILLLIVASLSINLANSDLLEETSIPSMGMVYYDDFRSAISWEDGFEDGDETYPSWDNYYTYSWTNPSSMTIQESVAHGGTKAVKFTYTPDGVRDFSRRLGLFITDNTETVYQSGFYWSFWYYIPSDVDDFNEGNSIGGLKWYFFHSSPYTYWSYGARWRLYKSSGTTRIKLFIGGYINSGYDSPQGGVTYDKPAMQEWTTTINKGAWNHFQLYLKSKTDATGEWQAWVNDVELVHLTNVKTHPNAFLTPTQSGSFFSGGNIYPHPQIMCYGQIDDPAGYYYADDAVIATEKVPEDYVVVGE